MITFDGGSFMKYVTSLSLTPASDSSRLIFLRFVRRVGDAFGARCLCGTLGLRVAFEAVVVTGGAGGAGGALGVD